MKLIPSTEITGVLLSGGKSQRMNSNKALLKLDGLTLVEHIHAMMKSVFEKVVISTNNPEEYNFIDAEKITDLYPGFGPLAGIHSAVSKLNALKIFIVSTDLIFLQPSVIRFLIDYKTDEPIVVPKANGKVHFMCGLYDSGIKNTLGPVLNNIQEARARGEDVRNSALSIWNFAERVGVEIIDVEFQKFFFNDLFFNVNSPADYDYAKSKFV